jgi:hypothetical protein
MKDFLLKLWPFVIVPIAIANIIVSLTLIVMSKNKRNFLFDEKERPMLISFNPIKSTNIVRFPFVAKPLNKLSSRMLLLGKFLEVFTILIVAVYWIIN